MLRDPSCDGCVVRINEQELKASFHLMTESFKEGPGVRDSPADSADVAAVVGC